jgi:CRP/FNR family transcriptional regulator, cyclic AMP receptor protein
MDTGAYALRHLPDDVAGIVASAAKRRRYPANVVIFHEGDPGDTLHFVVVGHVKIVVNTPLGQQLAFRIIGPGESFGELALFSGAPARSASALTLDATETLAIRNIDLDRLRREHECINEFLLKVVSERVLRLSTRVRELLYLSVEVRILRRLLDLCEIYGQGDAEVVIPLSKEDIGDLAGASRSTASTVLNALEPAGVLRNGRRHVTVTDLDRLRERAGVTET